MSESEGATAAVQAVRAKGTVVAARPRPLTPAETAWLALIPCAILMLAAIMLLGPPLGRVLFKPGTGADILWPPDWWVTQGKPEPVKHGRYIVAVVAPMVLALAIFVLAPLRPHLRPRVIGGLIIAVQASVVAFVAVEVHASPRAATDREFALAAVLVAAAALAGRQRGTGAWVARLAHERRLVRVAGFAVAATFAALWVIEVFRTDSLTEDSGDMNWITSGTYAVLNGHTPLVDVHIIYAKLLPYPAALVMAIFGGTTSVFTAFLAVLTLAALLMVYAVYRRIAGSVFALVLFLPFVALSDAVHLFPVASIWPMRYGGAYLLAWLTARHIDGRSPRAWILFLVAGLTMIDMFDFGLAATLASIAALLFARPPRSARDVGRLAREVGIGLLGAAGTLTIFTLLRAGEPPHFGMLLEWSRIFTGLGWFSLPLPRAGIAFAIYATYTAAIAAAAVRVVRRANDVLLTGMLAWSGVLGLMGGNYYVVRPDAIKLAAMFSAWGFALGLLTIVSVRPHSARDWRSPTLAELLVLFGFALSISTIDRIVSPDHWIRRIASAPPPTYRPMAENLVSAHTHRGEKVAILLPESYRLAYELGLDNVAPYEMQNAIVTLRQLQTTIEAIEREDVTVLFTPAPGGVIAGNGEAAPEQMEVFLRTGFQVIETTHQMIAWAKSGSPEASARDRAGGLLP